MSEEGGWDWLTSPVFRIQGAGCHAPLLGRGDTMAAILPSGYEEWLRATWAEDGPGVLAHFSVWLLDTTSTSVERFHLGDVLHHATFRVTRDPDVVRSYGQLHPNCENCRDGIAQTLAVLEHHPGLVVSGRLHWADITRGS